MQEHPATTEGITAGGGAFPRAHGHKVSFSERPRVRREASRPREGASGLQKGTCSRAFPSVRLVSVLEPRPDTGPLFFLKGYTPPIRASFVGRVAPSFASTLSLSRKPPASGFHALCPLS